VVHDKDDDLAVGEASATTSRITDIVVAGTVAAGDENVVATVVDVGDDTVALIDRAANSVISGILHAVEAGEAQLIRLGPVDETATGITTVVTEPGVEGAGIATIATIGHEHGDRGDGTTRGADGIGAGTKVIIAPGRATLPPIRGIDTTDGAVGSRDSSKSCSCSWT